MLELIFIVTLCIILVIVAFKVFIFTCEHDWVEKEKLVRKSRSNDHGSIGGYVYIQECTKCHKIRTQEAG
jgi:hypothetical protein